MGTIVITGICIAITLYFLVTQIWGSMTYRVKGQMAEIARDLDGTLVDDSTLFSGPNVSVSCTRDGYALSIRVYRSGGGGGRGRDSNFSITIKSFPSDKRFSVSKAFSWAWWEYFARGHSEKNTIFVKVLSAKISISGDDREYFAQILREHGKVQSAVHAILAERRQGGFGVSSRELRSIKTFHRRDTDPHRVRELVRAFADIAAACACGDS